MKTVWGAVEGKWTLRTGSIDKSGQGEMVLSFQSGSFPRKQGQKSRLQNPGLRRRLKSLPPQLIH
jgi:hypothetical protein